ncbi:MAG: hypothetical protein HC800_16970 [Phormidesmis sp. RL_2_1]|nr:hypothetical protein [Phormidesmis sp. RL_2_1]
MSTSPFTPRNNKTHSSAAQLKPDRLTRSQALIITAGLAGLIGLGSGSMIRFALAGSTNTHFLNPLQTFPARANWSSELPIGTTDNSWHEPNTDEDDDGQKSDWPQENQPADSSQFSTFELDQTLIESLDEHDSTSDDGFNQNTNPSLSKGSDAFNQTTFDSFAARDERNNVPLDPWETLKQGPTIGGSSNIEHMRESNGADSIESNPSAEQPVIEAPRFDSEATDAYLTDGYTEDEYAEDEYTEDEYTESDSQW